ncbi:MAG: hypothetical protein QOC82_1566 [Frankiaceae bacterium]|jgi:hypothetical protein|nr:hypothetical protein [Frankiaceae bacterium]
MNGHWKVGIVAAALAVGGTITGVAVADSSGGTADTGSGATDAPVPPGYSGINDPDLQACMARHDICNPDATAESQTVPWTMPLPAGASIVSRDQAQQFVLKAIGAPATAQVFSELLSGSVAESQLGIGRSSNVDESRPVWVITVVAPTYTDGGPAAVGEVKPFYSALVDAGSGQITDDCTGCDWLTSSK